MKKKRIILIHGNGGSSGEDNWFPWLKKELQKLGVACENPTFPDPILAKSDIWLPYLEEKLQAGEDTILVGHSSGAIAAMRYAENHRIYGSVLVGVYYTDLGYEDEKASGYFDKPWSWDKIKSNQNWVAIFASADDPYIGIEDPRFIRDHLDAEYIELSGQGHFGGTGPRIKLEFPEILTFIKRKLDI